MDSNAEICMNDASHVSPVATLPRLTKRVHDVISPPVVSRLRRWQRTTVGKLVAPFFVVQVVSSYTKAKKIMQKTQAKHAS